MPTLSARLWGGVPQFCGFGVGSHETVGSLLFQDLGHEDKEKAREAYDTLRKQLSQEKDCQ